MANHPIFHEKDLLEKLRNGDEHAFSEIYRHFWKPLFVMAIKRLGDKQDAEEIVQNIFLNLWRRRQHLRDDTQFDHYFAVATKFEVISLMRKKAHALLYKQQAGAGYDEADMSTLRLLDMHELQEKLQLSIKKLPEKCQLVFRLKHVYKPPKHSVLSVFLPRHCSPFRLSIDINTMFTYKHHHEQSNYYLLQPADGYQQLCAAVPLLRRKRRCPVLQHEL